MGGAAVTDKPSAHGEIGKPLHPGTRNARTGYPPGRTAAGTGGGDGGGGKKRGLLARLTLRRRREGP
jgi:hypothetical protein